MSKRSSSRLDVPGRDRSVIYLDFDGVLHPELTYFHPEKGPYLDRAITGHKLFEHAPLLVELLAPYPEVCIVLSTSWVRVRGYGRAVRYLPKELQTRVIGATFHSEMSGVDWVQMARGYQVLSDARRRKPRDWIALDDDIKDWPATYKKRLICCHGMEGLGAPGVADVLKTSLRDWQQDAKS